MPRQGAILKYIDRSKRDLAIQPVAQPDLPDPSLYKAQLKNCNDDQVRTIMRDNRAGFLGLA